MKLATYRDGSRDGQLVVVSRDLTQAHYASTVATRLQQVLDDWNFVSPQLEELYLALNQGRSRHAFAFEPQRAMAPLPRAYQWVCGAAGLNRLLAPRSAPGAVLPEGLPAEPRLVQGGSDALLGPCDEARFGSEDGEIAFGADVAVITGDLPAGVAPARALEGIRLVMLANHWRLRRLFEAELDRGFGVVQGHPAVAFSPVAITPDELGRAWSGGRVHLALRSSFNGQAVGAVDAGAAMDFHFGELIAHLARTRPVRTGAIVGAGAASHSSAAFGDTVRIEMPAADGSDIFGAIEQRVVAPDAAPAPARDDG